MLEREREREREREQRNHLVSTVAVCDHLCTELHYIKLLTKAQNHLVSAVADGERQPFSLFEVCAQLPSLPFNVVKRC